MPGEKSDAVAEVEASSFEDSPPEYSHIIGSDPGLSIDRITLSDDKGFEKTAAGSPSPNRALLLKCYSKCTRCEAHVGATEYHYGCSKCTEIVTCICQKCRDNLPTCRIHKIDLIKRNIKPWLALPLWADYISPTPTKYDNLLIHALKSQDDDLTTIYSRDSSLLSARTYLGYTPLHFAAHLGLASGASILLSHGALTNARDNNNNTPLLIAILLAQPQIVHLLLQNNSNIHSVGGLRETTALHAAAANGFPALVSLLLERGAIIDTPSARGTALQLASRIGSFKCASILLEKGANPNARSEILLGEPPIISAVRDDNIELVDLLTKYGANVNLPFVAKDGEFTALYVAVSFNLQNMVRRLVGHGADVNWRGKGTTCLMRAAALGFVGMCGLLIDGGAQIDWESDIGINALFLAAMLGKEDTFDVLLERGASGKPPKVCSGKWKFFEKFCKGRVSKEMKGRMLKKLRAAKRQ